MSRPTLDELIFYDSTHRYFLRGVELKSVTTVLEDVGITDFSNVPFDLLEQTRILGDFVHKIAHLHALNDLDEGSLDPSLIRYYDGIKLFFAERVKKVLYVEARVFDWRIKYAGTLDIIYLNHQNRICLDDYKTGQINPLAAKLQTAAYKKPAERLYGLKIIERASVWLSPTGSYKRTIYRDRGDFDGFVHALATANLKTNFKESS